MSKEYKLVTKQNDGAYRAGFCIGKLREYECTHMCIHFICVCEIIAEFVPFERRGVFEHNCFPATIKLLQMLCPLSSASRWFECVENSVDTVHYLQRDINTEIQ